MKSEKVVSFLTSRALMLASDSQVAYFFESENIIKEQKLISASLVDFWWSLDKREYQEVIKIP